MATTKKKALLSKLKTGLARKRSALEVEAEPSVPVVAAEQTASLADVVANRRATFLQELRNMLEKHASTRQVTDRIRLHLSYFPDDRGFHRLLPLLDDHREALLAFLRAPWSTDDDMMGALSSLVKDVLAEDATNEVDILAHRVAGLLTPVTREAVLDLDDTEDGVMVFDALQFMPRINDSILPGLLAHAFQGPVRARTKTELRRIVYTYVFDHQFDGVVASLSDANVSDDEKQFTTTRFLQDQFESTRSQQCALQILDLIDTQVKNFHAPLQSISYRFLPEKKDVSSFKRFMEVILDVVICKVEGSALEKHFPNKSAFLQFQRRVMPLLPDKVEDVIRARCREEFDQPFLYRHAHRVRWNDFLKMIQEYNGNRLISMEIRLYDYLQKHSNQRLEDVLSYMQDATDIDRRLLGTIMERFISSRPYKEQASLRALMDRPVAQIQSALQNLASTSYVETLRNLGEGDAPPPPPRKEPSQPIRYLDMVRHQAEDLYKLRPFISRFRHVAIRPFGPKDGDNVLKYMRVDGSPKVRMTYAPANDLFFQHLADPSIDKIQQGKKFTINGVSMIVANVTMRGEYIIQDEEAWQALVLFVQRQLKLQTVLHPLAYMSHFNDCPVLQHHPDVLRVLRQNIQSSIHDVLAPRLGQDEEMSRSMETSIFEYAQTMGQYIRNVARLLAMSGMPPQFRKTFDTYLSQRRLNLMHVGELFDRLEILLSLLMPEMYSIRSTTFDDDDDGSRMVRRAYAQETEMHVRRIMLDAYATEFPTRRLPYLPMQWDRSIRDWRDLQVDVSMSTAPPVPDAWTARFLVDEEHAVENTIIAETVQQETFEETVTYDPLSNFLETALDTMTELFHN